MSKPMSEAPAVISAYATGDYHVSTVKTSPLTEYVRKDIYDAYRKAVDAWDKYVRSGLTRDYGNFERLMQAARRAGESVK